VFDGGVTLDNFTIDGTEIDLSSGDFTLDVAGEIVLDADGGNFFFNDAGTSIGRLRNVSSDFVISSEVSDKDLIFKGNDGGSTVTALTLDMSAAGAATFNSTVTIGNVTIDGDKISRTGGAGFTIDVAGDFTLDVGGGDILIKDDGTSMMNIGIENSDIIFNAQVSDKDIIFKGNDGGSSITALTLDMSDAGTAIFNHNVKLNVDDSFVSVGADADCIFRHDGTDSRIENQTGNLRINNDASDSDIIFGVNDGGSSTEVARFDASTAALAIIDGGGSQLDGGKISIRASGSTYNLITTRTTRSATGTNFVEFFNSSGNSCGKVNHNGTTSVNYVTSSDYRLKENVVTDWDATTRLKQLKPSRFNFIAEPDKTIDGFLAHEVSSIVPEAITGTKDEIKKWNKEEIEGGFAPDGVSEGDNKLDDKGNSIPNYQGIDHAKIVPLLTKALQEQQATIEALTARITALEGA
jgi:hypothetical protein